MKRFTQIHKLTRVRVSDGILSEGDFRETLKPLNNLQSASQELKSVYLKTNLRGHLPCLRVKGNGEVMAQEEYEDEYEGDGGGSVLGEGVKQDRRVDGGGFSDEDKGALRRAGAALGI